MTKPEYDAIKKKVDKFDASPAHIYDVKSIFHAILDELYKITITENEAKKECPTELRAIKEELHKATNAENEAKKECLAE